MKLLVVLCIYGFARIGGSINTRDSQSAEKQTDFINNGVMNAFVPAKGEQLEFTVNNQFITLAFINLSWLVEKEMERMEDLQEQSKYGMGRVTDADGRLVHVTDSYDKHDHSGCNMSLSDSFGNPLEDIVTPWIALIKRGGCDFEKKIMNVYKRKASGVIIYNNISGLELNYMKLTKKELLEGNITSVFTPMNKGEDMARKIEAYENVYVSIKAGTRLDRRGGINVRSSVLFVTISFIIVMVLLMLWPLVYYYRRLRYKGRKIIESVEFDNDRLSKKTTR